MMRALPPWVVRLGAVLILALLACEGGGNSGSETTNGLTGTVRDLEGFPVSGARVLLLPEDFDPAMEDGGVPPAKAVTDAKGVYRITDAAPGRYHLELSDSARGALTLIQDVEVPAGRGGTVVDGTLGMPGSLAVRVADFLGADEKGYLYIPGTTAMLRLDTGIRTQEPVRMGRVPVGRFLRLLLVVDGARGRKIITLAQDFQVLAESTTTTSAFRTWKFSRPIAVNTAAAGVAGTLTDFPLLVRLDAGNFDFSQAQPGGRDLRFSKVDGDPLPFQIERWNADAGRAEVWVRLDTVRGNAADQAILMHWGRDLTAPELPGRAVFDASSGFATVYHLDEAANGDAGGYKDATPNLNHATADSVNPEAQVAGIVGDAKAFSGTPKSAIGTLAAAVPPGMDGDADFTVSFWMRFDTTAVRQTVLEYGSYTTLKDMHFLIRPDTVSQFGPYDMGTSGANPATWQNVFKLSAFVGKWIYVATVHDASKRTIATYVNGVKMGEVPTPPLEIDASGGLRIGRAMPIRPTEAPFKGALDEIRFCTRPFPADRIKLDYETQKP